MKGTMSLALDTDLIAVINTFPNRSPMINHILREKLMEEAGINEQIEVTKKQLASLEAQKVKIQERIAETKSPNGMVTFYCGGCEKHISAPIGTAYMVCPSCKKIMNKTVLQR